MDEKEQDLLGFSEPQLGNTAASWYDDEGSTQIGNKTERPLFVRSVDNGSDLANAAKDILKSCLKFCFINRISNTLLVSELLGTAIDRGTISIGFSKSAILLIDASKNIGLVMDTSGNVGVIKTVGVFGGIPSALVVAFASISSAPDFRKLEGEAFESGGSVGQGLCAGGEICIFTDEETGEIYAAVNLLTGVGKSAGPFEIHSGLTKTAPIEDLFNLYDEWHNFLQEFQEW